MSDAPYACCLVLLLLCLEIRYSSWIWALLPGMAGWLAGWLVGRLVLILQHG